MHYDQSSVEYPTDNTSDSNTHPNTHLTSLLSSLFPTPFFSPICPLSSPPPLLQIQNILCQFSHLSLLLFFLLFYLQKNTSKPLVMKLLPLFYAAFNIPWALYSLRSYDLVCWGGAVGLVALGSIGCSVFRCEWVKRWVRNREQKDIEQVYSTLFSPLHISRPQFSQILSCRRKQIRILHPGEYYAVEKVTRVDSLGVVLSGKLLVTQSTRPLHIINQFQFVDSPEYFGVSTDELFQVSITAVEESRLLVWHRDKLRLCIGENSTGDAYLREMFDHVIGRDVVRKLVQVSDCVGSEKKTPPPPQLPLPQLEQEEAEQSPLVVVENPKDSAPQTEELLEEEETFEETWSLSKIAEEETVV